METTVGRRLALGLLSAFLPASPLVAQGVLITRVSLTVNDSLGAPVTDANVSVVHGLRDTVAGGVTGPDGVRQFNVPRSHGQVQLIIANPLAGALGAGRLTLLEEIKPEHIAEMSYKDCFDTSMPGNFASNALFIVLKPGVAYEVNYGSYAADATRPEKKR